MADLFRKTSLEKLSSPEQLDKMIVITPLSFWIAMLGAVAMIGAALVWSIFGRLPINVEANGIYIHSGGTYTVHSEAAGIVEEVVANRDDIVEKGDVLARLDSGDVEEKIEEFDRRIAMVEAVTMESEGDAVNADNSSLMDIKNQMLTLDQTLKQNQAMLELRTKDVAEKRAEVNAAEQKLREAENAYYASMNIGDSTGEQLAYTEAQSNLANASGYLESAYSSLDQAQVNYTQASGQYQSALAQYNKFEAQEKTLLDAVNAAAGTIQRLYESKKGNINESNKESELNLDELFSAAGYGGYTWSNEDEWKEAVEAYRKAAKEYMDTVAANADMKAEIAAYVEQYKRDMDAAKSTRDNYQEDVNHFSAQKQSAQDSYNSAKEQYVSRVAVLNQAQANANQLSNAYSIALTNYNNEDTSLTSLIDTMNQMAVQVEVEQEVLVKRTETIYSQFEATKAAVIDQLSREREQYEKQLEECTIRASVSGVVSNVSVVPGSAVNQGSEIAKVAQGDGEDHVVVCYVPLNSGKKIAEGMEVLIYPTTVNKQEYGHMEATVQEVDSYVTSTENLRTQLGNDNLVESFLQEGPVVAVVCKLREDENTASGYYWSSKKGSSLSIEEGTLVEAGVVIEEKAPITMLIPYLKEKLTIQAKQ